MQKISKQKTIEKNEERFFVTGMLYYFYDALIKEHNRRQSSLSIDSVDCQKSISKNANTSMAEQLFPMIKKALANLEQGLSLGYRSYYEDKINLKKQIDRLYKEKSDLLWGMNTRPYKKHENLMVYQIFLPLIHACVSMGDFALQRNLGVLGAFKTDFSCFLFRHLQQTPFDFPFVEIFFDVPSLYQVSVDSLEWLLLLKKNTQITSMKLKSLMHAGMRSQGVGSYHFWEKMSLVCDLNDNKIDALLDFINRNTKKNNNLIPVLENSLPKIIFNCEFSGKLPDNYFDWLLEVIENFACHDTRSVLVSLEMAKKWIYLMVLNHDISVVEGHFLEYFLNQLTFDKKDISGAGIPLSAFLYRIDSSTADNKAFEYAYIIALSKSAQIFNDDDCINGLFVDFFQKKLSKWILHPFWKQVVKKYEQTIDAELLFLKEIAKIWNCRPNKSADVLFFQDFMLETQDLAYFEKWEEWTFGAQAYWYKPGLLGLKTFFEMHVPNNCLFKQNAIADLASVECDYLEILKQLILKKQGHTESNADQESIETWATRRLVLLTNWININSNDFKNFNRLYHVFGENFTAFVESLFISDYLHRTQIHGLIGDLLNAFFNSLSFNTEILNQVNVYSKNQILDIQEKLLKMLLAGEFLGDEPCKVYFEHCIKSMQFFTFTDPTLVCLSLKLAVDPLFNPLFVNQAFNEMVTGQLPWILRTTSYTQNLEFVKFWNPILNFAIKLRTKTPNPKNPEAQRQQFIQFFQQRIQVFSRSAEKRSFQRVRVSGSHAEPENNMPGLTIHGHGVYGTVANSISRLVNRYILIEGESAEERNNRIFKIQYDFSTHFIFKNDPILHQLFMKGLIYAASYHYVEPTSRVPLRQILSAVICALMDPDAWPNIQALQHWRSGSAVFELHDYELNLHAEHEQRASIIHDTYLRFRNTMIRSLRACSLDKGVDHDFLIRENGFEDECAILEHAITHSEEAEYVHIREGIKAAIQGTLGYQERTQGIADPFATDHMIKNIFKNKVLWCAIDILHRPDCPSGIVNNMVYALQGVHPDVRVHVLSKETVIEHLSVVVREGFYHFFDLSFSRCLPKNLGRIRALKDKFLFEKMNACINPDARDQADLYCFLQAQMKGLLNEPEYYLCLEQNKHDPTWATADAVITAFTQSYLPYLPVLGAIQEQLILSFRDQCLLYWRSCKKECLTDQDERRLACLKQDWQTKGFLLEKPEHRDFFEDILQTQRLQTVLVGSYPALWETEIVAEAWLRKILMHDLAQDAAQEEDKDSIFRRLSEQAWVVSDSSSSSVLAYKRMRDQETEPASPEEEMLSSKMPRL